jgi:hypothetical protein
MDQCFDIGYYSQGAMSAMDAYSMPVNVRAYYYAKLVRVKEQEAKAAEDAQKQNGRRR